MFKKFYRQLTTYGKHVGGTWHHVDATTAYDSVLGTCRFDPDNGGTFFAVVEPFGEVHVSIGRDVDDATYAYARSVLVHLPRLDPRYRSFAAADIYEFHQLLGPQQKLSKDELAQTLRLTRIQLLTPCTHGGTIWYSAGNQIGGANVGVRLDTHRRYMGAGCG